MPTRTRQAKTATIHNLSRQHHRLSYFSDTAYFTTTDYSVIHLSPSNTTSTKNKEKRRITITKIACTPIKEIQSPTIPFQAYSIHCKTNTTYG